MAPGATLKTSKSAPVTPVAAAAESDSKPGGSELMSKLSEKSPILAAVITTAFATNPALKGARSYLGPSCAGFRDFLLRGPVVDMAVAIVLGLAFVELIKAFIACLITPLFAAIWKKDKKFADMKWVLRGSEFAIGKFINIFLAFVLVCLILYYLVVLPTMHLQEAVNPKESRRPCPKCLEDIAAGAERCPHCTSVVPIAARLQARMDADVTGEIREDLEEVRNNGSSYFSTLKSWIPGTGGSGGAGAGASAKGEP